MEITGTNLLTRQRSRFEVRQLQSLTKKHCKEIDDERVLANGGIF
jgi:hypothetical protein